MSIYSYPDSKVIDQIVFKKTANGAVRAYLHANNRTDNSVLDAIKSTLSEHECDPIPFTLGTEPMLEVRGFGNEKKLLKLLSDQQWIEGTPDIKPEKDDQITWRDRFGKNTLRLSGIAMAIADVGFSIYGMKEAAIHKAINPAHKRDFSEAMAGLSYLTGSSVLTLYGRNDQSDIQVREIGASILQAARMRGMSVPDKSAAVALGIQRKENVFTKIDNFFREYPSEIGNMMYFTAGLLISQSALRHRALAAPRPGMTPQQIRAMRKGGWGDTALGASTMAAGLIATVVKEKAHDPDEPKKHGLAAITDWIQSSPLAMASYLYIGSTLCHAYTTYTERKEAIRAAKDITLTTAERALASQKMKAVPWRVLFIGMTLVGELLLSISSKGHGEGVVSDNSVDNSAIATAADLIVNQPLAMQDDLIEYMAKYLGSQDVLAMADSEVVRALRTQVEAMRQNPWALVEQSGEPAVTEKKPAADAGAAKSTLPAWQAKVSMNDAAPLPAQSI